MGGGGLPPAPGFMRGSGRGCSQPQLGFPSTDGPQMVLGGGEVPPPTMERTRKTLEGPGAGPSYSVARPVSCP